jgi:hypothetical protein
MRSEIVLLVATLGLVPVASHAQGGAVACPSIQNDQERLACYDRAMRGAPRAEPAPQAPPLPAPAPTPGTVTSPAVVVAGAAAATAAPTTTTAEIAPAPAVAADAVATVVAAPPAQAAHAEPNTKAATPPQPAALPSFDPSTGAPTGVIPVVVLSTLSRPGYGTEFTTDTRGVWIQSETKPLILPKTPFNAQLQPGTFGSTFLVLPGRKLGIRVRAPSK